MKKIIQFCIFLFLPIGLHAENIKVTVLLDWFPNPNHAPLFVAKDQGFFKKQGLDVELIGAADPGDPPKLVAAGKADIAITYEPQFMQQVDQGWPLIRIGTLITKPLNCLVVLQANAITKIRALKGKRVGYSSGFASTSLKTILENNGLTLSDITSINVHYNLTQALLSKKVDFITGVMRNFELIQMELLGQPVIVFYPENEGIPTYSELIFVAHKNKIKEEMYKKFLIALSQGTQYLQTHPESTWEKFSKLHPEADNTLNKRAWFKTIPYFTTHPERINFAEWHAFENYLIKNNSIKKTHPMHEYSIDLLKE